VQSKKPLPIIKLHTKKERPIPIREVLDRIVKQPLAISMCEMFEEPEQEPEPIPAQLDPVARIFSFKIVRLFTLEATDHFSIRVLANSSSSEQLSASVLETDLTVAKIWMIDYCRTFHPLCLPKISIKLCYQ
jgi:hypothetical protein